MPMSPVFTLNDSPPASDLSRLARRHSVMRQRRTALAPDREQVDHRNQVHRFGERRTEITGS